MTRDSVLGRAALVLRTVAHLRPEQLVQRVRLRSQKAVLARWGPQLGGRLARPAPRSWGWPDGFVALDASSTIGAPSPLANAEGSFTLLANTRVLGDPPDWEQPEATQLWRYHLHYFEWAWAFLHTDDRLWSRAAFGRLWRSWKAGTTFGRWDAWSPYVVSLRTWTLCGLHHALVAGSDYEPELVGEISLSARYVHATLERDVGGNHLIKNLKALVGAGVFLGDEALIDSAVRELRIQLDVQILGDGGHYERSPSYHCQVLGDLIDIEGLLLAAGRQHVPGLNGAINKMRGWLGAMTLPDGAVPLLNDCTPVGAERLLALKAHPPKEKPLTVLEPSGYIVVRSGRWHLVADVGLTCPPDLPAHAHADTLSFVLWMGGRPALIDSGTSEYGAGPRRQYERSTAAHNTVEIDGADSTEVFGAFRAARLARPHLEVAADMRHTVVVTATHDGYRGLRGRPIHRRTWKVTPDAVEVVDEVLGRGRHTAVARFHVEGTCNLTGSVAALGPLVASVDGGRAMLADAGDLTRVGADFGLLAPAGCLEVRTTGVLPLRMRVRLSAAFCPSSADAHRQELTSSGGPS